LRGAVTLALALAVTENNRIDPGVKNAIAILATGFVLFTLLVNGLTLRPIIRLLKLDRLSPLSAPGSPPAPSAASGWHPIIGNT